MNRIYIAMIVMSVAGLSSCDSSNPGSEHSVPAAAAVVTPTSINDFKWLNGWWQSSTPEGVVFEQWTVAGDALTGKGGFIKGTDTMVAETILLETAGKDIMYIPTVRGQNNDQPVPFKLSYASADSFVFENPEHDFPSVISYRKLSGNALRARISGKINGEEQAESFELNRVD
jgi:hypothetical protein